jgi:preprotein translocase subunit SecF
MNKVIRFTKLRFIMFAVSAILILAGIYGTVSQGGFNLGIDFQAGLNQRVQVAPVGMTLTYTGDQDAVISVENQNFIVEVRGETGVSTYEIPFTDAPTLGELESTLENRIEGLGVELQTPPDTAIDRIVTGLSYPEQLGEEPVGVNVANADTDEYISIGEVRQAISDITEPEVQIVGEPHRQEFLIRAADPEGFNKENYEGEITSLLEGAFGADTVVVKQSDYVGPSFSRTLAQQSYSLVFLAIVLILIYIWVRFKLGYAVSAISALIHDVAIMLGFIGTIQLEVSTTTIAAVLTIIGYSLNDTIVVFDRVRENEGLLQGREFEEIINTSITQSLSRTLITSATTMLAVLALYFFGTGPIKDFALALIVGIIIGTYSSIYMASPVLLAWRRRSQKRKRAKHGLPAEKPAASTDETKPAKEPAAAAAGNDTGVNRPKDEPDEIPSAQRKLKGKRQQKKKKKS